MENFYFFTVTYSNDIFLDFYFTSTYLGIETEVGNLLLSDLLKPPSELIQNLLDFLDEN